MLEASWPGDRFRPDKRRPDRKGDLGMLVERGIRRVAAVNLAVLDGCDPSMGGPDLRRAERLAPLGKEIAEGVFAVNWRLDVNDPVGGMRVQPVEAVPAGDEGALGSVLGNRARDADASRHLPWRAVHEDRQVRVNVKKRLLTAEAADPFDLLALRARSRAR